MGEKNRPQLSHRSVAEAAQSPLFAHSTTSPSLLPSPSLGTSPSRLPCPLYSPADPLDALAAKLGATLTVDQQSKIEQDAAKAERKAEKKAEAEAKKRGEAKVRCVHVVLSSAASLLTLDSPR